MKLEEHNRFLYGEPETDDECLCEIDGARLSYHYIKGWICPECERKRYYDDLEEIREYVERREAMEEAMIEHDMMFNYGKCTEIRGKGFKAFHCRMPWYA